MNNNDFNDVVLGRNSIRRYDATVKISKEEMDTILTKATKAPSAVNLQPWRMVVVSSEEGKNRLRPFVGSNVLQNDTSSAMIVIFGDLKCYEYAEEIYNEAVASGKMPEEVKEKQLSFIVPMYQGMSTSKMKDTVNIDASLMAMQLMLIARSHGYDTNAIGGYKKEGLAEAFELDASRYLPVLIISIGKADEAGYESVRLSTDTVVKYV
ncbi:nitroreductase family protein [Vagococcus xieshaowenii]|uniref:Nitroreductase family protein n=1 Tax=Vagococcus xieshaowenii TaxID=2562451 RepID=A0AAJ5JLP8_9ENTE|nr:nitroreductase family protein [Vagococcus xieshaowenii]QCA28535.1 nitroreductase family protein [Vagococcus xieshaowenii]TFZ40657.1 nitroreductase family protein [Vagococcus xieshaowenii]